MSAGVPALAVNTFIDNSGRKRDSSGKFAGGMSVKGFEDHDLGYKRIMKNIRELDGMEVHVGFPGGTKYEGAGTLDAAGLALIHELGSRDGSIPKRPANRMAFDKNEKAIEERQKDLYGSVLRGVSPDRVLKALGVWYEAKLRLSYLVGPFKPNAPATIAKKGSSRPLIDTKSLVNSITSKLFRKGREL